MHQPVNQQEQLEQQLENMADALDVLEKFAWVVVVVNVIVDPYFVFESYLEFVVTLDHCQETILVVVDYYYLKLIVVK